MAITTVIVCIAVIAIASRYLQVVEQRQGVVLPDPIHQMVGPYNLTWPTFIVLYGSLITAFIWLRKHPNLMLRGLRAYSILLSLRLLGMYLLALNAPPSMIPLNDPIVQAVASDSGATLTKDLFFSGHTSVMFMAALVMPSLWKRRVFLVLGTLVGVAVVLQHVHYTVDVMVAPMAAITAVMLAGKTTRS